MNMRETVLMITDHWDLPRTGVALWRSEPHIFECIFDVETDDYSDRYRLWPISEAELEQLSIEYKAWAEGRDYEYHAKQLMDRIETIKTAGEPLLMRAEFSRDLHKEKYSSFT